MKKTHVRAKVMCIETGRIYRNASAAARAYKRTRCAIANHLAGRAPTLSGLHFVRVPEAAPAVLLHNGNSAVLLHNGNSAVLLDI